MRSPTRSDCGSSRPSRASWGNSCPRPPPGRRSAMSGRKSKAPPQATLPATPSAPPLPGTVTMLRSSKILDEHLERLAVVYVRQSSPQQVLHHRESRERQYALVDHAVALGWPRDRVVIIDDDQGRSARTSDQRGGFQRLLAERVYEKSIS